MEEQNSKQPQFEEPTKTPKRVVRTYQEDLARMSKDMKIPVETKNNPSQKETAAPIVQKKPEAPKPVPTPEKVTLEEVPTNTEVKKHYVEEIKTTEDIDITNTKSFTEKDIDQIINTPPKQNLPPKPVAKPFSKPQPIKQPLITTEESSTPKQGFMAGLMSWLLGGTGNTVQKEEAPIQKQTPAPITPPKKLESVPVIPNVEPKKEEVPTPKKEVEVPAPAPAPKVELPKPQTHADVVLKKPEEAPKPSSSLFAPPKEIETREVPKPIIPPAPRVEKTEFKTPSPISTYTSDARKGIAARKETPLSVLAQQQDARKAPPKKPVAKKGVPLVVLAIAFLTLGVVVIGGAFFFLSSNTAPVATPTRVVTPVFAEDRTRVSASATPTLSDLSDLLSSVGTPIGNSLTHVTFSIPSDTGSLIVPFSDILLATNGVPGTLARSVYPQSMLGVYGENKEPVLVLAVTSFERSFKSLLSWESAMPSTLAPLFGELNTESVSTTTPPYIQKFVDEEIETTDARILYDAGGNTHLIYGFVTPNILFVTQTKETFIDLTDRIVRE